MTGKAIVLGIGVACSDSFKKAVSVGDIVQYSKNLDLSPYRIVGSEQKPVQVPNPNFCGIDISDDGKEETIVTIEANEFEISRVIEGYQGNDLQDTLSKYGLA